MLASLPGVLVIALLAGGHIGGEWSGKTIRTMLTNEGRRGRVLVAKWVSLWVASAGVMLACWAALAVAGPVLSSSAHLPHTAGGLWAGTGIGFVQVGRALAILALFSGLGVAAATLIRNAVGTIAVVVGVAVVALMVGAVGSTAQWTPATSIQAWMHFDSGNGDLPTNYWSRFLSSGAALGTGRAVIELVVCAAVVGLVAARRMRADVTV
jgi:ABC-type transport system involved in multi-copper enzyme maturation permease subunit